MEQDIAQHLTELVEAVKNVAPEVWAIYVRQQIVEGVVGVLPLIIFLVTFCLSAPKADWSDHADLTLRHIVAMVSSLGVIIGMVTVWSAALHLMNPEYYAIQALLP